MTKYTKIPTEIIINEQLTPKERLIMIYLCMRAGNKKYCFPSLARISKDMRISRKTITETIKKLEDQGYIKKERRQNSDGGNSSNLYKIINDAY